MKKTIAIIVGIAIIIAGFFIFYANVITQDQSGTTKSSGISTSPVTTSSGKHYQIGLSDSMGVRASP